MSILIVSLGRNLDTWIEALKKTDPSVPVLKPDQVTNPSEITFALAWNHPPGMFRDYPNLGCISSFGAGVDHLVQDPDIPAHVAIARIIDPLLSQDMYEFALAVTMKHFRRLSVFFRYQLEKQWKKHRYQRIKDVKVGVMGTGMIGDHVAKQFRKVGFEVIGWGRTYREETNYKRYYGLDQLNTFLAETDILICLLPLTDSTKGIINHDLLMTLPQGAYVINLGRGPHVVDEDLIRVIDDGHIAGAHLDVFDPEPLPAEHPFWSHPKIDITPHVASITDPYVLASQVIDNYHRLMNNKPLQHVISREKGY